MTAAILQTKACLMSLLESQKLFSDRSRQSKLLKPQVLVYSREFNLMMNLPFVNRLTTDLAVLLNRPNYRAFAPSFH